jgi:hypothetical protein
MTKGEIKMKNVIKFLNEVGTTELKLSDRKGVPIVSPKQRNEMKRAFMKALELDLNLAVEQADNMDEMQTDILVGFTAYGVTVGVANETLERKGLFELPFKIDVKVGNLDFDTSHEIEMFYDEQKEKELEKEKKKKLKTEKIERDKMKRKAE